MTDQLHLYERIGHLYWEDWSHFRKPRNWIHGTIIGRRDRFPRYPDEARGEDTALVQELVNRRASISLLSGKGYLYIYTYNGENCWTMRHHLAISQATRKPGHELEKLSDTLRRELSAYELPYRKIVLPHDSGAMEFAC